MKNYRVNNSERILSKHRLFNLEYPIRDGVENIEPFFHNHWSQFWRHPTAIKFHPILFTPCLIYTLFKFGPYLSESMSELLVLDSRMRLSLNFKKDSTNKNSSLAELICKHQKHVLHAKGDKQHAAVRVVFHIFAELLTSSLDGLREQFPL